jgi:hypothetical protein
MPDPLSYAQRILSGRTFRLLHIAPAPDQHQQLECYCLPYNIDESPPYEALSYVWGNPNPSDELFCNGQSIQVGPSLSHALRRLRYQEATRIVWVDAICINQEDKDEKSHQVPMMGSIYSLAKRVVVWLGQGDAQQTRKAFECSAIIALACLDHDERQGIPSDHSTRHEDVILPEKLFDPLILSSLKELYVRPWFSRIWCIQEIRLAADAQVIWGDDELPWFALAMSASWIFDKAGTIDARNGNSGDSMASLLDEIPVKNADMLRDKDRYHLLDALQHFREAESTEPKDKVYGLLNIVSPRSEVEALGVDYGKSVDQVYADTVLTVIQLYSRLTAFAYITHHVNYNGPGSEDDGNPKDHKREPRYRYRSWAPRWDDWAVAPPLGVPEDSCPWSACGEYKATKTVEGHMAPEKLCLKGVVYGKVIDVEGIMDFHNLSDPEYIGDPEFTEQSANGDEIMADAEDVNVISDPIERHPFIKAFERTDVNLSIGRFARTLTRGCWGPADDYLQLKNESVRARHIDACSHTMRRLLQLERFGDEGEYGHNPDSAQFQQNAYYVCEQRRLFWTEKGLYGLGPHCMQIGDIVVVLYGGNTPYVLRPRGDEYIFMGQAYVDDIMNGELFQGSASDVLEEQTFCLI